MYKKFTQNGNRIWIDELMNFYNNKIHRSIGVSPTEASENPNIIQEKINNNNNENNNLIEKQKFNIGDRVRIFKWKNKFWILILNFVEILYAPELFIYAHASNFLI